MDINARIVQKLEGKSASIAIGLGENSTQNLQIIRAASSISRLYNSKISIICDSISKEHIFKKFQKLKKKRLIDLIEVDKPEQEIIKLLLNGTVDGVVRGAIGSSKFLPEVKKSFNIREINRLAILATKKYHEFFFGPVGIDECNTFEKKKDFIEAALEIFKFLSATPKISVLSGGRNSDIGRDPHVDKTINDANALVSFFKEKLSDLDISHDEILIEKAIKNKSNLIIAPDGISGNLIYRTLVHLGGGTAYGAIYMGIEKVIVDTSRVGHYDEFLGGLSMAIAFAPQSQ